MVKAQEPKKSTPELKTICASGLISLIHAISVIFLIISGFVIVQQYCLIILGNSPNQIKKMALDYSITIFTGSAIFLLVYIHKFKEIVKSIFDVKDVEPIDNSN